MTDEIPKMIQQTGIGIVSSMSKMAVTEVFSAADGGAEATLTAAVCTFGSGAAMSGCVLVIFTVGAGGAAGSGKILMRAVSFFGPACVDEPG